MDSGSSENLISASYYKLLGPSQFRLYPLGSQQFLTATSGPIEMEGFIEIPVQFFDNVRHCSYTRLVQFLVATQLSNDIIFGHPLIVKMLESHNYATRTLHFHAHLTPDLPGRISCPTDSVLPSPEWKRDGPMVVARATTIPPRSSRSIPVRFDARITHIFMPSDREHVSTLQAELGAMVYAEPSAVWTRARSMVPVTFAPFMVIAPADGTIDSHFDVVVSNESDVLVHLHESTPIGVVTHLEGARAKQQAAFDKISVEAAYTPAQIEAIKATMMSVAASAIYDILHSPQFVVGSVAPALGAPPRLRPPRASTFTPSEFTLPQLAAQFLQCGISGPLPEVVASGSASVVSLADSNPVADASNDGQTVFGYINSKLSREERADVLGMLMNNQGAFADADIFHTPLAHGVKHNIVLQPGTTPIKQNPYRASPANQAIISEYVANLKKAGLIRESNSPWASPVIVVSKEGSDKKRVCVDLRRLNSVVQKDAFPLPRVEDCLNLLHGARHMSILDLKDAYHHVPLTESSIPLSAFVTKDGLFEFKVMTFGHCNAPATFQRYVGQVLQERLGKDCVVYFDDIVVYTKGDLKDHLAAVDRVLKLLAAARLSCKASKCQFAVQELKFLGHIVSSTELKPDPEKIRAITDMPIPSDVPHLRSFLGFLNYYRDFVKNFAIIAKPLYRLTRKDVVWQWGPMQQAAFQRLKDILVSSCVLRSPDFDRPFILQTDASYDGFGAVLSQNFEDGEHPVSFASTQLNEAQQNYSATDLECTAVVWAVKRFAHFLADRPFTVETDHSALVWLPTKRSENKRLARFANYLSQFNFVVRHRSGIHNANADALSRLPLPRANEMEEEKLESELFSSISPVYVRHISRLQNVFNPIPIVHSNVQQTVPRHIPFTRLDRIRPTSHRHRQHTFGNVDTLLTDTNSRSITYPSPNGDGSQYTVARSIGRIHPQIVNVTHRDSRGHVQTTSASNSAGSSDAWFVADLADLVATTPLSASCSSSILPREPLTVFASHIREVHASSSEHKSDDSTGSDDLYESFTIEDSAQITRLLAAQLSEGELQPFINFLARNEVPSNYSYAQIQELRRNAQYYLLHPDNGGLYYCPRLSSPGERPRSESNMLRLVIPLSFRKPLMEIFHDTPFGGHLGLSKTLARIRAHYYWPSMYHDISTHVGKCASCLSEKIRRRSVQHPFMPVSPPQSPFDTVSIDFSGPFPLCADFRYMLTILDSFSKWVICVPTIDMTARTAARVILSEVVFRFGIPRVLLSDQGSQFTGELMSQMFRALSIDKRVTSTYRPEGNGGCERVQGTIKQIIHTVATDTFSSQWAQLLPAAVFAYNTSVHEFTQFSPYFMLFGHEARIPLSPLTEEFYSVSSEKSLDEMWINELLHTLTKAHNHVRDQYQSAVDSKLKQLQSAHSLPSYSVGDLVYCARPQMSVRRDPKSIRSYFEGPFRILRRLGQLNYEIRPEGRPTARSHIVNVASLRASQQVVANTPAAAANPTAVVVAPQPSAPQSPVVAASSSPVVGSRASPMELDDDVAPPAVAASTLPTAASAPSLATSSAASSTPQRKRRSRTPTPAATLPPHLSPFYTPPGVDRRQELATLSADFATAATTVAVDAALSQLAEAELEEKHDFPSRSSSQHSKRRRFNIPPEPQPSAARLSQTHNLRASGHVGRPSYTQLGQEQLAAEHHILSYSLPPRAGSHSTRPHTRNPHPRHASTSTVAPANFIMRIAAPSSSSDTSRSVSYRPFPQLIDSAPAVYRSHK